MTPQIKQRIEQINNGQVPEGYKKTEFGVFPKEWDLVPLSSLLDFKNGVNADKEKYNSGVKMISVMDILADSPICYDNIRGQVDIDEKTLDTYSVTYGDLLFQRSSETFEDAGKSNVYLDKEITATYSGFVIRGKKKAEYQPYYLNEALRIAASRNQITRNSAGSQHINVGQDSLSKVIVPFASKTEQEKIAEILMKWDEAIELYGKQIEKLKNYKSICLKKMFPAHKKNIPEWRFKGFTKAWEQRKACEICSITTGKSNTQDQVEDGIYPFYIRSDIPVKSNRYLYDEEAVITIGDGNIGKVFHYVNGKFDLHQRCYKMADFNEILGKYFYYFFSTKFYDRAMKMTAKATVDSVRLEMISDMDILFPKSKDEQKAIAGFLSALDNLITLHQRKVEIIKHQRKVLQQYLLNGIVRVKA